MDEIRASVAALNAAARTATSRTATYNIITTYEIRGLLRRDSQGRYTLGWGLL